MRPSMVGTTKTGVYSSEVRVGTQSLPDCASGFGAVALPKAMVGISLPAIN